MQHNVTTKLKPHTSTEKPLPDTHGESVDVFVQLIQQSNWLDDHVVGSVDIKLYFGSGVTVAETQLGLGGGKAW